MYTADWQPPTADQNSPTSPAITDFRKRSLPPHIIEAQKKEALTMVSEKELSPELGQLHQTRLPFFRRHFYRPAQRKDGEINEPVETHRFSFLSRGFLTLAAITCLILIAILCAVLATVFVRHHKQEQAIRLSPVKQAVFANFPDPVIIQHEDTWYAMATNNGAGKANHAYLQFEYRS